MSPPTTWPACSGDESKCVCRACCVKRGGVPHVVEKKEVSEHVRALLEGKPGFVIIFDVDFQADTVGMRGESFGPDGTHQLMSKFVRMIREGLAAGEA